MPDIDRMIAKAIVKAQIASDAGKGNYWSLDASKRVCRHPLNTAYGCKPDYILTALRMIRSSKDSIFSYYAEYCPDQNGFDSILVYFEWKLNGMRYQCSFHTPYDRAPKELKRMANSGRKTRWNRITGGSQDACQALSCYFQL